MPKTKMSLELPNVGDELYRCISPYASSSEYMYTPIKCKVTYVNKNHRWYKVKFEHLGIEECFGIPVFDHSIIDKNKVQKSGIPIVCWENGTIYSTIRECAKDLDINYTSIVKQLNGAYQMVNGYHFSSVL